MNTVQVALHDSKHAQSLRDLLLGDGGHQVQLVDRPDLAIAGVIVMDFESLETGTLAGARARMIVMAPKTRANLTKLWEAGVQHVVFQGDAPRIVRMAVLAAELSLLAPRLRSAACWLGHFRRKSAPRR